MVSRILLVDDDSTMLYALTAMVERRIPDAIVETCESAHTALEQIARTDYDAIVSDVKMPGMDGFALMERVLAIRPTTPTLLVTGHGDHDMGVKALNSGAYAFIPKPIEREFFLAWLKRAIQLRQLNRTVEQHTQELEQTVQERTAELQHNNRQLQTVAELHRESEALYRSMAEAMPQIVYTTRPDGATDYVNQQWVDYTGVSKDKALKLEWMQALHPDDVPRAEQRWSRAVRDGAICETEYRLRRADGEYRWHLSRAVPQRDEQGCIVKWIGTSTDIHDRKSSEEALRESEDRYKRLVKYSPDAILINRDDRIVFVNDAGLALFRATQRDQLLGASPFDLFHPACHPLVRQRITRLREGGEPFVITEEQIIRLDGAVADVEVMASTFLDQGRWAIHVILRDITERKQVKELLQKSEGLLQRAQRAGRAGVWEIDLVDGRIDRISWSDAYYELFGLEGTTEPSVEAWLARLHPDDRARIAEEFRVAMEDQRDQNMEFRIVHPDGTVRWMHRQGQVERDAQGHAVRVSGITFDVTERKHAEEALRRSEATIRLFIEQAPTSIAMLDRDLRYVAASRRWIERYGRGYADLAGQSHYDVHPDLPDRWKDVHRRCLAGAMEACDADRWETADGTINWLHWEVLPWRNTAGEVGGIIILAEDITAERDAQRAMIESERRFRATFENAAVGIAHVGMDGRWLLVNDRCCAITGYPREELVAKTFADITHPEDIQSDWDQAHRLVAGKIRTYSMEKRYIRKDGTLVWINLTVGLVRDSDGSPQHFISVIEDIDDRKRAEAALSRREAQLQLIADTAPVYIAHCDREGRYKFVNKGYAERFGVRPEDCHGKHIEEVVGVRAYRSFRRYVDMALDGQSVEFEVDVPYEGTGRRFMHCSYVPERAPDGTVRGLVAVISDITRRRDAEEALQRSLERLELAQQAAHVGAFEWNIQADVNMWTPELEALYGLPAGRFGGTVEDWIGRLHPDDRARTIEAGMRAVEERGEFQAEFRVVWPDGSIHWLAGRAKVMCDSAGCPLRMVGVNFEITELKRAEERIQRLLEEVQQREQDLRGKQEQLVQAAKLASLGEIATGVAHEINNPLNNIGLFVGNVLYDVEQGRIDHRRIMGNLHATLEQTKKAATIVEHLRAFGRRASTPSEQLSVNRIIRASVSLIEPHLRVRNIEVAVDLSPHDPKVMGNAIQIEQVLINLLTNARDAVERAPRKVIRIESATRGSCVEIRVSDTGNGIPADLHARIFDPFFTTKEVGKGTGLGLSISYGIIQEHQGEMTVKSEPGHGTTFVVTLPLLEERAEC
jgi:PAS domain S-box-containing protein